MGLRLEGRRRPVKKGVEKAPEQANEVVWDLPALRADRGPSSGFRGLVNVGREDVKVSSRGGRDNVEI